MVCSGKEEARTEFASSELLKDVAGEMQVIIREGEVEARMVNARPAAAVLTRANFIERCARKR